MRRMLRANDGRGRASRAASACSACTDVSGFGLADHLGLTAPRERGRRRRSTRARSPRCPARSRSSAQGLRSTFHAQNVAAGEALSDARALEARPAGALLFDPQTSGGLLFGVAAERTDAAVAALREEGDVAAAVIGRVEVGPPRIALV